MARPQNLSYGAVSVATAATRVVDVNNDRDSLLLSNNGASAVFLGDSAVTTSTGLPLAAGASLSLNTGSALYAVTAAGSIDVRYLATSF